MNWAYLRLLNQIMRTSKTNIILRTIGRYSLLFLLLLGFVAGQTPEAFWAEFGLETHISEIPHQDKEADTKDHKEEVDDKDEYEFAYLSIEQLSGQSIGGLSKQLSDLSIYLSLNTPPPEQC